jgi:hypothetical protein
MAGAAGDGHAGAFDLRDVVAVDFFGHRVHKARNGFHPLGIIGEVEARAPVWAKIVMIFGVAGIATNSKGV